MTAIVVSGATGRMGRALGRLIVEAEDLHALGGIAPRDSGGTVAGYPRILPVEAAGDLVRECNVVVDFSAPDHLRELVRRQGDALAGRALVVGTTGLDPQLDADLDQLAGRAAVLTAANFSVGVNLLLGLVARAARSLSPDGYDVEIVETHHAGKEDAPSGTALALGEAVALARGGQLADLRRDGRSGRPGRRPSGEIGFHALRGGDVVGDHEVHFLGARERLTLGHTALSRDLFAEGALVAARWMAGKGPGRYSMGSVLGLED
jgi:4-hydroxy-tetrahydrodipicolinate reductase